MFWSQKVGRGDNILLRFTENAGGPRNPSAPIDVNAFRTTNFFFFFFNSPLFILTFQLK